MLTYLDFTFDLSMFMNFRCNDINSGEECDLPLGV